MACHLVSRAQVKEIAGCSAQHVELAAQQLQGALCTKIFKKGFLGPSWHLTKSKGEEQGFYRVVVRRKDMVISLKQQECAQVVHSEIFVCCGICVIQKNEFIGYTYTGTEDSFVVGTEEYEELSGAGNRCVSSFSGLHSFFWKRNSN